MKTLCLTIMLVAVSAATAQDTAESIRKIREYKNRMALPEDKAPSLEVKTLRVGVAGKLDKLNGKVMQIVNPKRMLVGIEDAATSKGDYEYWIAVNCSTVGIAEGKKFDSSDWSDVVGGDSAAVIGTVTYKTVSNGNKTVLVLQPSRRPTPDELLRGSGKPGAAAYDIFPDKMREILVKDWEHEAESVRLAIKGDEERLRNAKTRTEVLKYQRAISDYQNRLAKLAQNAPPYFTKDAETAIRGK